MPAACREVVVHLTVRRFRCTTPDCPVATFAEQVPGLTSRWARRTQPVTAMLARIGLVLAGRAGARLADGLGVGVGAHSHLAGVRSWNPGALVRYIGAIDADAPRIVDAAADASVDGAMLALRLDDGLDLAAYASRYGIGPADRVRAALRGLDGARLLRWRGDHVRLSERGRLLASEVFLRLLPDEEPSSKVMLATT